MTEIKQGALISTIYTGNSICFYAAEFFGTKGPEPRSWPRYPRHLVSAFILSFVLSRILYWAAYASKAGVDLLQVCYIGLNPACMGGPESRAAASKNSLEIKLLLIFPTLHDWQQCTKTFKSGVTLYWSSFSPPLSPRKMKVNRKYVPSLHQKQVQNWWHRYLFWLR